MPSSSIHCRIPQQDRIVRLSYRGSAAGNGTERSKQVSVPDVRDWQEQSTSFAALSYYSSSRAPVLAGQTAEYAVVARVTPEFFGVFSAVLSAGRFFTQDESRHGEAGAAIVSDRYAFQHFGDPVHAIGRTLRDCGWIARDHRRLACRTRVSGGCRPVASPGS